MTVADWLDLLFRKPPSPPDELVQARRETIRDVARVRRAARNYRAAVDEQDSILDRIGDIRHLIRDGDGP